MKTIKLIEVTDSGVKVSRINAPTTYSVWVKEDGQWSEVSEGLTYSEAKDHVAIVKVQNGFERVTFLPAGTDAKRLS